MKMRSLIALMLVGVVASAQSFEVASIEPHNPKESCSGANLLPGGRFTATCWPLQTMIQEAYDVLPRQVSGGPTWIDIEPYDITAKAEGFAGEIPMAQFRSMLRPLIRERFHLILREETKSLPGLALVVARKGPKLIPNNGAPFQFNLQNGPILTCRKVTIAQLAAWMKPYTGAGGIVVDQTGLSGEYDFSLQWTARQSISDAVDNSPSLFTALQEQLGLRLKSQKVPTKILVIEHVERPTDN